MDAVKYVKTLHRLCKSQANCLECPLHENCEEDNYVYCNGNASEYVEKSVHIVEQWAKDNPIKTRQSEFLRMFPNADFCKGVIDISPCSIEKEMKKCCGDRKCDECKRTYWLTEVTNDGNGND